MFRLPGSAIAQAFRYKSGRVVAVCRLLLAGIFLFALWIDPSQPVRSSTLGYVILTFYLALALALVAVAWKSWWFDYRLAWTMHVLDGTAFLVAIYFTEGAVDEFTSPFLAFFAFLLMSATIRWGWRITLATGTLVTTLYLVVGLSMEAAAIDFDSYRFGRRVAYMVVLGVVLTWFGLQRQAPMVSRLPVAAGDRQLPIDQALSYAMAEFGAARGAILWFDDEEPGHELATAGLPDDAEFPVRGAPKTKLPFTDHARIFDLAGNRGIFRTDSRLSLYRPAGIEDRSDVFGQTEGLTFPCRSVLGRGEILLFGIEGMTVDHLELAEYVSKEVGAAFDRHATMALSQEAAVVRFKESVARDVHDTIAQSLAAVGMQLEGLRRFIASGGDPLPEINALKQALRTEQRQVRALIEQLRDSDGYPIAHRVSGADPFSQLAIELEAIWKADLDFDFDALPAGDSRFQRQLTHILREAVANAVRHGKATRIQTIGRVEGERMQVVIRDNGAGFPAGWHGRPPRTLAERVDEMMGTIELDTCDEGTILTIGLPLVGAA